jgi:hypothetical protein
MIYQLSYNRENEKTQYIAESKTQLRIPHHSPNTHTLRQATQSKKQ